MNIVKYCNPRARDTWSFESLFGPTLSELSSIEPLFERLLKVPVETTRRSVICDESEDAYELRIEVPGFSKKQIQIEIDQTLLKVLADGNGVSQKSVEIKKKHNIRLPEGVDSGKASASLENGVLSIRLPKKTARKPLKIKVK